MREAVMLGEAVMRADSTQNCVLEDRPEPVDGGLEQLGWQYFATSPRKADHPIGVEYIGKYDDFTGVDEAVRRNCEALEDAGVPLLLRSPYLISNYADINEDILARVDRFTGTTLDETAVIIRHTIPSRELAAAMAYPQRAIRSGASQEAIAEFRRRSILFAAFESSQIDAEQARCYRAIGGVWVPCQRNQDMLERNDVRSTVIPHSYAPDDPMLLRGAPSRRLPGQPFTFLMIGKWEPRKAQHAAVGGFLSTFGPKEDVRLVIKTSRYGETWKDYPADLSASIRQWLEDPDVLRHGWDAESVEKRVVWLIENYPREAMVELYHRSHAFVSSGRAEGFDLPSFDAKLAGLPLIHAGWGGTEDFAGPLDERYGNDQLQAPIHEGYGYLSGVWSGHTHIDVGAAMRRTFSRWGHASRDPSWAPGCPVHVRRGFGREHVGMLMRKSIEVIASLTPPAVPPEPTPEPDLQAAA